MVAEEDLDALARTAGCVARQPRDASEVGGLIERDKESWRKYAALRSCFRGGSPDQRHHQGREERPATLGILGRCYEIERAGLREQPIQVKGIRS